MVTIVMVTNVMVAIVMVTIAMVTIVILYYCHLLHQTPNNSDIMLQQDYEYMYDYYSLGC